jgi:molybdopterin biosynthesis enzyme
MSEKWADQLISGVKYNPEETHIVAVRAHADNGVTVAAAVEMARSEVVRRLKEGQTFCTITKTADNKWKRGANVQIVTIEGQKYIRTTPDATKADNLGDLPRF